MFSLKSFYEKPLSRMEDSFLYDSAWKPKAPATACLFLWLATRGVILTSEDLRKLNVFCISWCFLYKVAGEQCSRKLLLCRVMQWNGPEAVEQQCKVLKQSSSREASVYMAEAACSVKHHFCLFKPFNFIFNKMKSVTRAFNFNSEIGVSVFFSGDFQVSFFSSLLLLPHWH